MGEGADAFDVNQQLGGCMELFTPIWKREDLSEAQVAKARRVISEISDQRKLCEVVLKGNEAVRLDALRRIDDQELLAEIACAITDPDVRELALGNLSSTEGLVRVASEAQWNGRFDYETMSYDYSYNVDALNKIDGKDVASFEAVVENSTIEPVLFEAARRAGDRPLANAFLLNTFLGRSELYLRRKAEERGQASSIATEEEARSALIDLRLHAAECMCERVLRSDEVQDGLMDIVQKTNWYPTRARCKAASLLADKELGRQYAVASALVGVGDERAGMNDAMECACIEDPEVVMFLLDHLRPTTCGGEVARQALTCVLENVEDPDLLERIASENTVDLIRQRARDMADEQRATSTDGEERPEPAESTEE